MILNILIILAIIIGAVAVCIIFFSWVFARFWCKPRKILPKQTPENYDILYEPKYFISNGVLLKSWFIPANSDESKIPVIIIPHAWSSNSAKMLPVAAQLHKANYHVVLYDTRGHGTSGEDGPVTLLTFVEDIIACVDYVQTRPKVDIKRIGVLGHSIGGSSAIVAAAKDPRIRAVVSCSAFADPFDLTRTTMKRFHIPSQIFAPLVYRFIERWLKTSITNVMPLKHVGSIKAPILLIHGDADEYVGSYNLDILYNNADPRYRERMMIQYLHHFDIINNSQFHQSSIDFFNKNL
jgi:dipeptidyl aminopeptidase/acylaminoacyl peptidase